MNRRFLWLGVFACLLSTSMLLARTAVIKTKDGRTIEGELVEEKPDQIILAIKGIKTTIPRDTIAGDVQIYESIDARYVAKLAELPKNPTVKDRLDLARFLYDHRAYDLALREVAEAQKIDPNSTDAATLEQTIMSQKRIERAKPPANGGGNTGTTAKPPAVGAEAAKPAEHKFLGAEHVNAIRQHEWQKGDQTVPRVTVPVDVRRKFVDYKAYDAGEFAALTPGEQARLILDEGTPEMKAQVKITTDPQALADFRRTIQPLIVNNCATVGCHGNEKTSKFFLFSQNTDREEVAYTNFYLLNMHKQSIGDKEYKMIDRAYPDRSILAYFALPYDFSEVDHPEVKGVVLKPIVSSKNDNRYKNLVTWMTNLSPGEPRYGIKYTPGKGVEDKPKDQPKQPDAEKKPAATPNNATPTPNTNTPKPAGK